MCDAETPSALANASKNDHSTATIAASLSSSSALVAATSPPANASASSLLAKKANGAKRSLALEYHHHPQQQQPLAHQQDAVHSAVSAIDEIVLNTGKDPMNALWSFEGHTLRELLPLSKNPQHNAQSNAASTGSDGDGDSTASSSGAATSKLLDETGQPLLYGSCGRDKRYARCSVCYFRGLRSNSAHYCSCCQRPVCIRPRKYPNEEHAKICWNVLHMDKDMVSRVEKKKKRRRLHASDASGIAETVALRSDVTSVLASARDAAGTTDMDL